MFDQVDTLEVLRPPSPAWSVDHALRRRPWPWKRKSDRLLLGYRHRLNGSSEPGCRSATRTSSLVPSASSPKAAARNFNGILTDNDLSRPSPRSRRPTRSGEFAKCSPATVRSTPATVRAAAAYGRVREQIADAKASRCRRTQALPASTSDGSPTKPPARSSPNGSSLSDEGALFCCCHRNGILRNRNEREP